MIRSEYKRHTDTGDSGLHNQKHSVDQQCKSIAAEETLYTLDTVIKRTAVKVVGGDTVDIIKQL